MAIALLPILPDQVVIAVARAVIEAVQAEAVGAAEAEDQGEEEAPDVFKIVMLVSNDVAEKRFEDNFIFRLQAIGDGKSHFFHPQ